MSSRIAFVTPNMEVDVSRHRTTSSGGSSSDCLHRAQDVVSECVKYRADDKYWFKEHTLLCDSNVIIMFENEIL